MSDIVISLITIVVSIAKLAGMIAIAFYAIKLLRIIRRGLLEKGWKLIVFAAFCLIFGILGLDLSIASRDPNSIVLEVLGYSGAALQTIGAITIAYGFKSQYDVWNPKGMTR
jgi:stage V sporulation protein SpoVS